MGAGKYKTASAIWGGVAVFVLIFVWVYAWDYVAPQAAVDKLAKECEFEAVGVLDVGLTPGQAEAATEVIEHQIDAMLPRPGVPSGRYVEGPRGASLSGAAEPFTSVRMKD
jgi:hypothetical protein